MIEVIPLRPPVRLLHNVVGIVTQKEGQGDLLD